MNTFTSKLRMMAMVATVMVSAQADPADTQTLSDAFEIFNEMLIDIDNLLAQRDSSNHE